MRWELSEALCIQRRKEHGALTRGAHRSLGNRHDYSLVWVSAMMEVCPGCHGGKETGQEASTGSWREGSWREGYLSRVLMDT